MWKVESLPECCGNCNYMEHPPKTNGPHYGICVRSLEPRNLVWVSPQDEPCKLFVMKKIILDDRKDKNE